MVSSVFSSTNGWKSRQQKEKKCSLLVQLVLQQQARDIYVSLVKRYISSYLCKANKVKVKISPYALTVRDRSLQRNKLEKIPLSWITEAHSDTSCQLLCYFISETRNQHFRVLAFLCKSPEDSYSLVNNFYQNRTSIFNWNCSTQNLGFNAKKNQISNSFLTCENQAANSQTIFSAYYDNGVVRHSKEGSPFSHDNTYLTDEVHPRNVVFERNGSTTNKPRAFSKGDQVSTRTKIIREPRVTNKFLDNRSADWSKISARQVMRSSRPAGGRHAFSPKNSNSSRHIEEEFIFLPKENKMIPTRMGNNYSRVNVGDKTKPLNALSMIKAGYFNQGNRRRKGAYGSIQEYEEAMRNQTMSSCSGLQATSGSGNIVPYRPPAMDQADGGLGKPSQLRLTGARNNLVASSQQHCQQTKPQKHSGLQIINDRDFGKAAWQLTSRSAPPGGRSMEREHVRLPQRSIIQPQQLTNQLRLLPAKSANLSPSHPLYKVETRGKGDNYLKNEALVHDDGHKYFRQHGQRVKRTKDGGQQLYLDNRLAEVNDVIGDQMVKGRHAQKVHSGESVGANHRSKFHSEVVVSHKTSKPVGSYPQSPLTVDKTHAFPNHKFEGRKNIQPVQVTTHPWPPATHFDAPERFPSFQSQDSIQRFFQSDYNPYPSFYFNPGFQRFFESIDDFGPQAMQANMIEDKHADPNVASVAIPSNKKSLNTPQSDGDSDNSSIRSSASAYWPPELKFGSYVDKEPSWKFPMTHMKLRRRPLGTNVHQHQRRLI